MNKHVGFITGDNVSAITLMFWPRKLNFSAVNPIIIDWFDRIIKFNKESVFIKIRPQAVKGRNTLHVHPAHPGFDIRIFATYEFEGVQEEYEYKYKANSHYISVRNKLCPGSLNSIWPITKSSKENTLGFNALDEAFKSTFSSQTPFNGIHRGYGFGSDIDTALQMPEFKQACMEAIELEAAKPPKIKTSFKKSLASMAIDDLTDEELIKVVHSAASMSHVLLAHKWRSERMLELLKRISANLVDAGNLTDEDLCEVRALRSMKATHS